MSTLSGKSQGRSARLVSAAPWLRRAVGAFRVAPWICRKRLLLWGCVVAVFVGLALGHHIVHHTALGLTSSDGDPIADDFINYYAGARVAAAGHAELAYDRDRFHAFQEQLTGPVGAKSRDPWIEVRIYSYPPTAMLLSLPLALFSFGWALIVWTLAGAGLCILLLRLLVRWPAALLTVIAAPAAFFNLQSGQNGFYTAALIAGGLMLLDQRATLAGLCFGCLAYKPQMAVLLPFALAAESRWRTMAAAAITAIALVLISSLLFGSETWAGFIRQSAAQRYLLEFDTVLQDRMPTVFAAARELGAALVIAYGAQIFSAVLALIATVAVWRTPASIEIKAAAAAVATFLATPYALDYDAVILIFAAAWLAREGVRSGFLPWERLAVLALIVFPAPMVLLTRSFSIPIGPVVLWPILLLLVRRARAR